MPIVIAIDGPAGAGKSTVAKILADVLKFAYVDTGAMYRALTLKALNKQINLKSEEELVALAEETRIDLQKKGNEVRVMLDDKDVSDEIRTQEVTSNTHYIARVPKVREIMVEWQRAIGNKQNIVIEGRDVGTVVFPQATKKFYLDADIDERSDRRLKELKEKGREVDGNALSQQMKERDFKDMNREAGPLKQAEDAIHVNTTNLSIEQVVNKILSLIES